MNSISERASDPRQYDGDEIFWNDEGSGLSPIRRLFLENLTPFLGQAEGKAVLDIGCGQGWLEHELAMHGAKVTGIDPSIKNIQAARQQYPDLDLRQSDLTSFRSPKKFDMVTAIMVFEHFRSLSESFENIRSLLKTGCRLLMITSDFYKSTRQRHNYDLQIEELAPGETATRTDYGARAGVMYDIHRTTDRYVEAARQCGFKLQTHRPISAPDWLIAEQPRYALHDGAPLFHLFDFIRVD